MERPDFITITEEEDEVLFKDVVDEDGSDG